MMRNLVELWRYRSLVAALVSRHLNARYRGSILGFIWSFLNPLCLLGVYLLVFKFYIRFSQVEHYTLFMFTGLLPWLWFQSALLESATSISAGGSLITKAMFPPQILPVVTVLTNLLHFLFAVPLLLVYMYFANVPFSPALLAFPLVVGLELVFLLGLSLAVSALNVFYRDIQHILGNIMTLWFFLSPIIYPAENVPPRFHFTLWLNPVALFTQMYQQMFMHAQRPSLTQLAVAGAFAVTTLIIGNFVFNRNRESFAELI